MPELGTFSISDFIRLQTASFNRLYNYQLERYGHSLALRLAYDNNISIIKPEINLIYNINCNEIFINALLLIKPIDNLSIMFGTDIYHGKEDSLFDLINEQLTNISLGIRVDF